MTSICDLVIVDMQAVLRRIDTATGRITHLQLEETPFWDIAAGPTVLLKSSQVEAAFFSQRRCSRRCLAVVVTRGRAPTQLYCGEKVYSVPTFEAKEVDPTGAGDSFVAGLAVGLLRGLDLQRAVAVGNFFGALAVSQIGVPKITASHVAAFEELLKSLLRGGQERNGVHVDHIEDLS
eukprot:SM000148S01021  [mRNA]  locus=s148:106972:107848:- [translate_table: standard]